MAAVIRPGTEADISAVDQIYDHILHMEETGKMTVGWIRQSVPLWMRCMQEDCM